MPIRGHKDASSTAPGKQVTLFLSGDVMTGRGIDQILPNSCPPELYESYVKNALDYVRLAERRNGPVPRTGDFAYIWGDGLAELERIAPDLRIINLETAVTRCPDWEPKGINYRMHPDNVSSLTAAGIDCCVLANNHVLDWGRAGLEETLACLHGAGIRTAGAGLDPVQAGAPAVLEFKGGRVLVFAFGLADSGIPPHWAADVARPGIAVLESLSEQAVERIASHVEQHRRTGDIVTVSLHWGGNWGYDIPEAHIRFAHGLIDAGAADCIHGHSSHHVMGMEVYGGRPIFYGCGDLLNDYEGISGHEAYRGDLALMYLPTFHLPSGRLARLQMIPTRLRRLRINRASATEAEWLHHVVQRESARFGVRVVLGADGRLELLREGKGDSGGM